MARKDWRSPLKIPAQKIGEYEIIHDVVPANQPIMFNTNRNMIYGQQNGKLNKRFQTQTTWHKLKGPSGTWMTDLPIEQRQHDELLSKVYGRVLVGGLGLGYAVTVLAKRKTVKEIVVVEISQDVIDLVAPYTKGKFSVHKADLLKWLEEYNGPPFDYAFFDIWQLDGETTFHSTVAPLHRLSVGKVKHHPINWNEDVMRGQLAGSLRQRLMFLKAEYHDLVLPPDYRNYLQTLDQEKGVIFHDWAVPFWKWYKQRERPEDIVNEAVSYYAGMYARSDFEEFWSHFSSTY